MKLPKEQIGSAKDGSAQATVIFDRIESKFAQEISNKTSNWAKVHQGLDAQWFEKEMEGAEGKIIVVFDVPSLDERSLVDATSQSGDIGSQVLETTLKLRKEMEIFMAACQSVVRIGSLKSAPIQVWTLSHDDVACRQLDLAETPIQTQARMSCFKSLAKEYGRMGIYFNTCIFHPEKSSLSKEKLKTLKSAMKPFALRYKAPEASDLGILLESIMLVDCPVMNGGSLNLGNGQMEFGS